MKIKLMVTSLLFVTLVGCQSKSAFKYNEAILAKGTSLIPQITATENKVKDFLSSDKFDSVAAAGQRMEELVQQKIDEIKSMKVPKAKEADNFKLASLRYFEYIKRMYTGYKDLGNAVNPEAREKVLEDLREIINGKQAAINDMQAVQRKFANANGFKVK